MHFPYCLGICMDICWVSETIFVSENAANMNYHALSPQRSCSQSHTLVSDVSVVQMVYLSVGEKREIVLGAESLIGGN